MKKLKILIEKIFNLCPYCWGIKRIPDYTGMCLDCWMEKSDKPIREEYKFQINK